ncbi:trypco2 family protein [Streptomyces cinerochromogenes]|uniref:trypco2 family protein n=1 Tax=Streptomyces cinerochromogenes TaxID=66422 RepID=UPI003680C436
MIDLSDMIRTLRHELNAAIRDGEGDPLRFELGPVEIETTVAVEREAKAGGKVRFWVVTAETEGRLAGARTQRITLTLHPKVVAEDGTPTRTLISGTTIPGER